MYETHEVTMTKPAQRQLREKVIEGNAKTLLESVNTKSLSVRGWTVALRSVPSYRGEVFYRQRPSADPDAEYTYELYLRVTFAREDDKHPGSQDLASILRTIHQRASQPAFGKWTLATVDGDTYNPPTDGEVSYSSDLIGYADVEIPDDFEDFFKHLFGLDSHIGRIRSAMEAGQMSGWRNRYHCALVGPPGCGKSDICQTIKQALGEDAVMEFDATATTAAGAIKELSEREILPRVLIVEEIEKADEKALAFLLGVCDLRGEIRKTTARNTIQRDTKLFVIATVNDVPLFDKLQAGALSSRFSNKIWFKRPSRELLEMILRREVEKVSGDVRWIDSALDYAEKHDINDPRQVTALCLCGREMWLTGEYEVMLSDTADPTDTPSPV
jgi:hypothetical protein